MPEWPPDPRRQIEAERSRIEESAKYSAEGQIEASKAWTRLHWIVGGGTAIASGVTAVLTFAAGGLQLLAGSLAILAAIAAAVHVTLRPDKRAERTQANAARYKACQGAARRLAIHIGTAPLDGLRTQLETLAGEIDAVNRSADPIPRFAYARAKKNIEGGSQTFEADA